MNMPKEAGETARSAIDAMRTTPGLLAVILLQVATMAMIYFVASGNSQRQHSREIEMLSRCFPEAPHKEQ
jgi:hypothetical protein